MRKKSKGFVEPRNSLAKVSRSTTLALASGSSASARSSTPAKKRSISMVRDQRSLAPASASRLSAIGYRFFDTAAIVAPSPLLLLRLPSKPLGLGPACGFLKPFYKRTRFATNRIDDRGDADAVGLVLGLL